MNEDEDLDFDEIEEEIASFTFNRGHKREPKYIPAPVDKTAIALEEKEKQRAAERCPKCGAMMQRHKGSPRDPSPNREFRLVCLFCKNKQRRANAAKKREAKK